MIERFKAAAEAVGATVFRFPSLSCAVAHLRQAAGTEIAVSGLPDDIRNALSDMHIVSPGEHKDVRAGVSFAIAGIADTGTLLLDLSPPHERSASALPPVHLVFLRASSIVTDLRSLSDTLEDLIASRSQTYLSLTTGPSRTADIERVLTIGVHGPKELQVLILEGE